MNLAGKFLTFLILFMSIVFLVLSVVTGATHKAWKDIATTNKAAAENYQRLLDEAKEATTVGARLLAAEATSRQQQLAQLNSELQKERMNRDAKEKELTEELVIAKQRLEVLQSSEARLTQQDQEISQERDLNKNLIDEVAAHRQEVTSLTNNIFKLTGDLEELKSRNGNLNELVAMQTKVLKRNGLTANDLTNEIPPRIEAIVMKSQDDFIVVSAGTDDGLRVGHMLDIFRGDRFIGKAVISNPEYNIAAARILPEFLQAVVLEGDIVTTKF